MLSCQNSDQPATLEPQWKGIVPGESTKQDVEAILGTRDNQIGLDRDFPRFWVYEFPDESLLDICSATCSGTLQIKFEDEFVEVLLFIFSEESDGAFSIKDVLNNSGIPTIVGSHPNLPLVRRDGNNYYEDGIQYEDTAQVWIYAYPEQGIAARVGPIWLAESLIPLYLEKCEEPPHEFPVSLLIMFAPQSKEDFLSSSISEYVSWVRQEYFCEF